MGELQHRLDRLEARRARQARRQYIFITALYALIAFGLGFAVTFIGWSL